MPMMHFHCPSPPIGNLPIGLLLQGIQFAEDRFRIIHLSAFFPVVQQTADAPVFLSASGPDVHLWKQICRLLAKLHCQYASTTGSPETSHTGAEVNVKLKC